MAVKAGKSTDAEEQNLFDVQIGDEDAKKLDEVSKDILCAELANGSFLSCCSLPLIAPFYTLPYTPEFSTFTPSVGGYA